jgi:hypothetical protein
MQHALVEVLHELGEYSPYNDNTVRSKELFARVEHCTIEVNGEPDRGPHRFSIFNSALSGRRSASELFERVEEDGRTGAWWRLRVPYEEALEFAKGQKGFARVHPRVRQRQEPSRDAGGERPGCVKWNRSSMLAGLDQIDEFARKVFDLCEENERLKEQSQQLGDEITQLRQKASPDLLKMIELYHATQAGVDRLRQQLIDVQAQLMRASNEAVRVQSS